jgi:hypothetical protein
MQTGWQCKNQSCSVYSRALTAAQTYKLAKGAMGCRIVQPGRQHEDVVIYARIGLQAEHSPHKQPFTIGHAAGCKETRLSKTACILLWPEFAKSALGGGGGGCNKMVLARVDSKVIIFLHIFTSKGHPS